jgi:hypothetical protein
MSVVALPRNDPSPGKASGLYDQWMSNLVDTYNEAMRQIENEISAIDARLTAGGL